MTPRLVQTQIDRIVGQLAAGLSPADVAAIESVNKETVRRIKINNQAFNSPYAPRLTPQGRKRALTVAMKDALLEYLTGRPDAFLDEQQYFLWDKFDVHTSLSTISRTLKMTKWTNKKIKKRASERDNGLPAA